MDANQPRTTLRIVAENLRILRRKRHLSQEALALMADVDRSYVSAIERAECNFTIRIIEHLATALETDVTTLLTEPDLKDVPDYLLHEIRSGIREEHERYA